MSTVLEVIDKLNELILVSDKVTEDSVRVAIEGACLTPEVHSLLVPFYTACEQIELPTILVDDENTDLHDLEDKDLVIDQPWRVIFPKPKYASELDYSGRNDKTILFTSVKKLTEWIEAYDPFEYSNGRECDLSEVTTIRVSGLVDAFGGESLWVLPLVGEGPSSLVKKELPTDSDVNKLIHINCTAPKIVNPESFGLSWGNLNSGAAQAFIAMGARVLAASLVQELRSDGDLYTVSLKGSKKVSLSLFSKDDSVDQKLLAALVDAVSWVYAERPETRQQLIIDRLSIDIDERQTFVSGLLEYLQAALEQAKDSYDFVILERKDAYHKEMRELMKDMTAQANLYATKVRELINAVSRDFLGILVLLSFSYLARVNKVDMEKLVGSDGLDLLGQVLAIYLMISCVLQLFIHHRDAQMSYEEATKWTEALRHYTSRAEKEERFLRPIKARKKMLYRTMKLTGLLYLILILGAWNISDILTKTLPESTAATEQQRSNELEQKDNTTKSGETTGENKVVIKYSEGTS